jgi:class 3 adenylate cyclase
MPRRISDRLSEAARSSFVGRDRELALLRSAKGPAELPFLVAFIHGPGGIGKSCLLQSALSSLTPEVRAIMMDCREIEPTPKGFLSSLSATLGIEEPEPALSSVVGRLGESTKRTVLALDTYERFGLMDTWLRQEFIPALPETVLTAIAGREAPNAAWLTTPGWQGLFREISLRELPDDDASQLLKSRGLAEPQVQRVNRFARGHPLALELAAAALRTQPDLDLSGGPPPKVLQELTSAFLAGLPRETTKAVEAASTVRRVTEPLLRALLAVAEAREAFNSLQALPFVDASAEGLILHDVVRDATSNDLARRDPERYRDYRARAWRFFTSESHRAVARNLWQCTADMLYLIENPVVRDAFFPKGASDYGVEPATAVDAEAIRDIAASEDAEESVVLMRRWWEQHPETFSVAKTRDGRVAGFYILFEPADVDPKLLADDPLTAAWSQHLGEKPVADGERVLFLRRWLARSTGELPSPAQAACWLDIKRTYMELRPNLRRLYTTVTFLDTYAPIVCPLGFVPLEDVSVSLGGVTYHTALLDFGEASVDGWLATLVGAELGMETAKAEEGRRQQEIVTILFTDIVGSTTLTQRLGDAKAQEFLRTHNAIVRDAISAHGGAETKHTGDGIMASFPSASRAIECAIDIQKALASFAEQRPEPPLRVRIGLNAGEPVPEEKDLFGTAVQLAARICAKARPGQILVSSVVRELAAGKGFVFLDHGRVPLRGFEKRVGVHEVAWH